MRGRLRFLALAFAISGCGPVNDERISGPYKLWATDIDEQLHVCYALEDGCIGRIPATVFEVGYDDRHIVAGVDQHNDGSEIRFYYIIRSLDGPLVDPSVSVKGPFFSDQFEQEKVRLALPQTRPVS